MKTGPKPQVPSEMKAKGTFRNDRHGHIVDVVEPMSLPAQPDWLTVEAVEVWQDDIGRVAAHVLATEKDSTAFANYCCLQGMILRCWRKDEVPPVTALAEVRKLQELFGIAGARSRIKSGAGNRDKAQNPFSRNGRRAP